MPSRANKRIIYAHQAVAIRPNGVAAINNNINLAKGVQEVGLSTNFNNTPYFQLGQLPLYEDVEQLPDVQITMSKALDGRPLLYHMATSAVSTPSPTLAGRQNNKCVVSIGLFPDTNDYSTGVPPSLVECSGLLPSSLGYQFPVEGTFTESITLVGNDNIWKNDPDITNASDLARSNALAMTLTSEFLNDIPAVSLKPMISGVGYNVLYTGIQQRQHLNFTPWSLYAVTITGLDTNGMVADPFCTILPPDVDGISTSGTNNKSNGTDFDAHVQNINVSVDLGREELNELGRRGPYHRLIRFPVEVTCSIETISTSGSLISATENGILSASASACASQSNLSNRTIRIATCRREVIYLGTKNRLTSVSYGGGGTDGSSSTITYNYRNYNVLTVMAFSDPHDDLNITGYDNTNYVGAIGWWNTTSSGTSQTTGSAAYIPGAYYLVN